MSTAEFLLQVRELERTIWRLTLRRDELQSCLLPGAVRYDLDRVQTSPEDRFGAVAAAVADLDRKLQDLRVRKADLVIEVSEAIDELTDDREKTILTAYYVGRLPMTEIADRIGYSSSTRTASGRPASRTSQKMRNMRNRSVLPCKMRERQGEEPCRFSFLPLAGGPLRPAESEVRPGWRPNTKSG